MTRLWDGRMDRRTDGQTDGVTALLDLLSPSAMQVKIAKMIIIQIYEDLIVDIESIDIDIMHKILAQFINDKHILVLPSLKKERWELISKYVSITL